MAKANLRQMAVDLTESEGLKKPTSIGQIKEFIALLGIRWRELPEEQVMAEVGAIIKRAGKRSQHKKKKR